MTAEFLPLLNALTAHTPSDPAVASTAPPPSTSLPAESIAQAMAFTINFYLYLPDTDSKYNLSYTVLEATFLKDFKGILVGFKDGQGPVWNEGTKAQAVLEITGFPTIKSPVATVVYKPVDGDAQ